MPVGHFGANLKSQTEIAVSFTQEMEFMRLHMPKTESLELLILKSHLLIERILNDLISLEVLRPNKLQKNPQILNFAAKLLIVESLYDFEGYDGIYNILREINKLRNQYAHELSPIKAKGIICKITNNFYAMAPELKEDVDNEIDSFQHIVGCVLGILTHAKIHHKNYE